MPTHFFYKKLKHMDMPGYKTRQISGSAGPHTFLKASITLGISSVNSRFGAANAKTKQRPEAPFQKITKLPGYQSRDHP